PVSGATPQPAPQERRRLARELLAEMDARPDPAPLVAAEPDDLDEILNAAPAGTPGIAAPPGMLVDDEAGRYPDRLLGAWLGRAAGCL
ncbi:hypothetical protein SB719_20885, partial [Pantoea sp. SIMBA_079]